MADPNRGEIWLADLGTGRGREQSGQRPVLVVSDATSLQLDEAQRRFLQAIAYYASLGVDRVRLVAEAEHAEALREADRLKDEVLASVSHSRLKIAAISSIAPRVPPWIAGRWVLPISVWW